MTVGPDISASPRAPIAEAAGSVPSRTIVQIALCPAKAVVQATPRGRQSPWKSLPPLKAASVCGITPGLPTRFCLVVICVFFASWMSRPTCCHQVRRKAEDGACLPGDCVERRTDPANHEWIRIADYQPEMASAGLVILGFPQLSPATFAFSPRALGNSRPQNAALY
jgi:hypothetical protein